jgi:hypothetical protein
VQAGPRWWASWRNLVGKEKVKGSWVREALKESFGPEDNEKEKV